MKDLDKTQFSDRCTGPSPLGTRGRLFTGETVSVSYEELAVSRLSGCLHTWPKILLPFSPASGLIRQCTGNDQWVQWRITDRQIVLIPQNVAYDIHWESAAELVQIFPTPQLLQRLFNKDFLADFCDRPNPATHNDRILCELAGAICFASSEDEPDSPFIADTAVLIVKRLAKFHSKPHKIFGARKLTSEHRQKMDSYIQSNMAKPFRVPELARAVGLSPQRFTPLCRNSTGKTPMEYVWECRLWKAHAMACAGTHRRREIVHICGFADLSHLNRRFKVFFKFPLGVLMKRLKSASRSKSA